jgi:hypothetical protein
MNWKHIIEKWMEFSVDAHNIRLGLALNGVNPCGDLSSCHSTWTFILLNYNLPLWFITKCYFLMSGLIILGKESVTFARMDMYLEPLIEELQMLWKGVKVQHSI